MNYKKIIFILCLGIFFSAERKANAQLIAVDTFNYTGAIQTWVVPAGVTSITLDVRGAQGGGGYDGSSSGTNGGLGGQVTGYMPVTPGDSIFIYVGGEGVTATSPNGGAGGWNGGGTGNSAISTYAGGGGGGSSDLRLNGRALGNRIMIGGGGGGGGYDCSFASEFGGNGGGSTGTTGGHCVNVGYGGGGGTQSAGGAGEPGFGGWGAGVDGSLGLGGDGGSPSAGGGGGGGYYGGGGGCWGGAGGGSGYADPSASNVNQVNGFQSANGLVIITFPAFSAAQNVIAKVIFNGGNNGIASVIPSGGCSSVYTYSWAPGGQTTDTVSSLTAGIYSVTVTDTCGASTSTTVTLTQPNVLNSVATIVANVTCNGGNDGSVSAGISGGTSPYTFLWGGGQTTDTITGLSAGTYSVSVSDSCGGTASSTVTITQPNVLTSISTNVLTNVSCNGGNNGSASVSIVGGGTPYTYAWSSGATMDTASGLSAGTYTITVTDACGASASATATITEPGAALTVSTSVTTNVTCHGGNDGSASSVASGGTSAYTYLWNNGQTNSSANNLTSGSYTVTVTDNHGCTASASVLITQPTALSVATAVTANVSCYGGNDGSASSTVSGSVAPYTYSWTNGSTTDTATGLTAGSYTLTVTDNHGCVATSSFTITQPAAPLNVSANVMKNITCNAGNDGSAYAPTTGGTNPYTYSWTNGSTTDTATGLTAGSYTIDVTDNHGCTASAMVTITQPVPVNLTATVISNVSCNGGNNGTVTTSVSGGFIPYTYSWTNGATTAFVTGLTAGSYSINVTDNHGCSASAMVTITQPATSLSVTASTLTNVLCNGGNDGSVTSTAGGGTAPYTYAWSNNQTNSNLASLTAGSYVVTVTDNNGCTASAVAIVTQPNALVSNVTVNTEVHCNGGNEGSASSVVTGGTLPYGYTWTNGGTSANASGLTAGSYTLTVTDGNGCITMNEITITQPVAITATSGTLPDHGGSTGSAWVTPNGGIRPYTYLWTPGNDTTAVINGKSSGTYCCTITDSTGCTLDVCDTIQSDAGVANITSAGGQVNVYPNPNNGQFTIQYSVAGQNTVVEIYSVLGEQVYANTFVSSKSGNTINISNQPSGIYFYRVMSSANGNLLGEGKIILQK